jgi:hypothetical protein
LLDVLLEFTLYVSGEVIIAARDGVVRRCDFYQKGRRENRGMRGPMTPTKVLKVKALMRKNCEKCSRVPQKEAAYSSIPVIV